MKSGIVLINQDSGYLMIDIANAFADRFKRCHLIAGRLVRRDVPLKKKVLFEKIVRYDRSSVFKRLLTWSMGFLQILILVSTRFRNHRLFIVSNPPFAPLLPLFCRNRFSLLIFDVYPDALQEFGYLRENSILFRLWRLANRNVYARADGIFAITEGMKSIMEKYAGKKKITVVPVWTNNDFLKPVAKDSNPFALKHGLLNKFVVLYSGNIGYAHDVETVVELAARTKRPDIFYLIVGEGEKKQALKEKIGSCGLKNCKLLPFQPAEILPYSLASADVAVVSLGKTASKLSVPSKTYNFMSVGAPLLCIAEKDSELANLTEKYDIGKCFRPDQIEEMKAFVSDLVEKPEKRKVYGDNALKASRRFSPDNARIFLSEGN